MADAASVNVFLGQVAYSPPLDLPAGIAGFGPGLAITYAGELGNGPLGIGFTLGEIAIRRSLRHGVPSYTDANELELIGVGGGGRLIADATMPEAYETTRLPCHKAAWSIDQGRLDSIVSSYAKAYGADAAMRVATDAVQIFGGYGYTKDYPVEKLMRDAKLLQSYEGTSQISAWSSRATCSARAERQRRRAPRSR